MTLKTGVIQEETVPVDVEGIIAEPKTFQIPLYLKPLNVITLCLLITDCNNKMKTIYLTYPNLTYPNLT
jgi:hypothetical protein